MTDEAALEILRIAAHLRAMKTDSQYRAVMNRITSERQQVRAKVQKRETTRRMWSIDHLTMPRCWMHGPRWRTHFDVKQIPIADLVSKEEARWHRPGRKLLVFSLEDDIRELLYAGADEIRPGVYAEW